MKASNNIETIKVDDEFFVDRDTIYAGILSRLVISREAINNESFKCIGSKEDGKYVYHQNIRKIVFQDMYTYGYDLLLKRGKSKYCYNLFDPSIGDFLQPENNELFIRKFRPYGALLGYMGFDKLMTISDVSKVTSILLSSQPVLIAPKHEVELPEKTELFLDPIFVEAVNNQARYLSDFVKINLPTKPQKIEKKIKSLNLFNN